MDILSKCKSKFPMQFIFVKSTVDLRQKTDSCGSVLEICNSNFSAASSNQRKTEMARVPITQISRSSVQNQCKSSYS